MATTNNNTLPKEWDETYPYEYGDTVLYHDIIYKCIEDSQGDNPALDRNHWFAIDIYRKTATVMHHKDYSGDQSMWDRDVFWVDQTTGYVYCNNENTGINVKGTPGAIRFEQLTPEQIVQLKGDKGDRGLVGPKGDQGEKGDTGAVEWDHLTPEQIEMLKGDTGASAYDVWKTIPGHEEGTVEDFIADITGPPAQVDSELDGTSHYPIQNKTVYDALQKYEILFNRVTALEKRLQYKWNDRIYQFKFGVTQEGEFGFVDPDTYEVVPFSQPRQPIIYSNLVENADQILFANMANDYGDIELMDRLTLSNDRNGETTNLNTDNVLYATDVHIMNLAEAFNAKYYIFKDGKFDRYQPSINFFRVGLQDGKMISQGTQPIEGSWSGTDASDYASSINFVVKPVIEGTTIECAYGAHNTDEATLPQIVNGTGRISRVDSSFNNETTFTISLQQGQGGYFASINNSPQYEIVEIYMA